MALSRSEPAAVAESKTPARDDLGSQTTAIGSGSRLVSVATALVTTQSIIVPSVTPLDDGVKVSLNALLLSQSDNYRTAGISQYIYELLVHLRSQPSSHRFEAFVTARPDDANLLDTPSFRCIPVGSRFAAPARRIIWEQLLQPVRLTRSRPDLVHALGYALPLMWPGRALMTICDLSFVRFPELFNRANATYLAAITRLSARRATHIITISESTRRDVIQLFGVPPSRVTAIYCGVSDHFQPPERAALERFRSERGLPERFLLYLGTLEPRKNVPNLIRAYARLRERRTDAPPLVLAGGRGWKDAEVFALIESLGLSSSVVLPGYVPATELPLWYGAALAFVYPSRYEGFGLPVLEAMACGTPVVTSNSSSLPEVVGDAGLLIEPNNVDLLADALERVTSDESLRGTLSLAGRTRAALFRWDRMASETIETYERLGAHSPRGG